jgi:hypothetical protein
LRGDGCNSQQGFCTRANVASGQACAEPHYRWSEKIDTSLAGNVPDTVDVSDILGGWAITQVLGPQRIR